MATSITPSNVEVFFDDIIVSKTDLQGHITYVNRVFCEIAGYSERELLGKPHSIIRHPDMPRSIFRLLWSKIGAGEEVFAYVKNMCRNGDHYWVLAHVTPSFGESGQVIGYHSNRRPPERAVLEGIIMPLYRDLLAEEALHRNGKDAVSAGFDKLNAFVASRKMPYDELIFSL